MSNETTQKRSLSVSLGAAFLMATSAIGPGFLTQTSQFTAKYLSSFAFVIVCVIIMDMIAQTNVWSIVGVSGLRGQEIANKVLPGLGYLLVVLVVLGGLAFNIGNVGGVSLGFNAMIGIPEKAGVIIGGVLAICIFLSKKANDIVGRVAQILGGIIIVVMLVVAFMAKPPVGDAVAHIFTPENPKELIPVMVTLLGGSCGGYITFSGAHKLLDAGWGGKPEEVKHFRKSVLTGICVSGSVRILLFLCVLGVCTAGTVVVAENVAAVTGAANPAAEAFRLAAGDIGYRLFGRAVLRRYHLRHRRGLHLRLLPQDRSPLHRQERQVVHRRLYRLLHARYGNSWWCKAHGHPGWRTQRPDPANFPVLHAAWLPQEVHRRRVQAPCVATGSWLVCGRCRGLPCRHGAAQPYQALRVTNLHHSASRSVPQAGSA